MNRSRILAAALVLGLIAQDAVAFAPALVGTASAPASMPQIRFILPESVGLVDDGFAGVGASGASVRPRVILIQDAHANPSGQFNLAKALDLVLRAENIQRVYVEGGWGDCSLDGMRRAADPQELAAVARRYLRKGILHGEEYLSLTGGADIGIIGAEDRELYERGLEAYRNAARARPEALGYLDRIRRGLDAQGARVLNPGLLRFEAGREQYRRGELFVAGWSGILLSAARERGVYLAAYPQLGRFRRLAAMERSIRPDRLGEEERQAVLLLEGPAREEWEETSASKLGGKVLSDDAARTRTFLLAERLGGRLGEFPALHRYVRYLRLARQLSASGVLDELEALEAETLGRLAATPQEKLWLRLKESAVLSEKLIRLQITPKEYARLLELRGWSDARRLTGFVNARILERGAGYENAIRLEEGLAGAIVAAEEFYRTAFERDEVFLRTLEGGMEADADRPVVLITGGFHTAAIKERLRSGGVPFVSILPQVSEATDQARYERILLSQRRNAPTVPADQGRNEAMVRSDASSHRTIALALNAGLQARMAAEAGSGTPGVRQAPRMAAVQGETGAVRNPAVEVLERVRREFKALEKAGQWNAETATVLQDFETALLSIAGKIDGGVIRPPALETYRGIRSSRPERAERKRPLRIGVLGSAANPIHWVHLLKAVQGIDAGDLDAAVLITHGEILYKPVDKTASPADRFFVTQHAVEIFSPLIVGSDVGLDNANVSENNLYELFALNPDRRIDVRFIAGTETEARVLGIMKYLIRAAMEHPRVGPRAGIVELYLFHRSQYRPDQEALERLAALALLETGRVPFLSRFFRKVKATEDGPSGPSERYHLSDPLWDGVRTGVVRSVIRPLRVLNAIAPYVPSWLRSRTLRVKLIPASNSDAYSSTGFREYQFPWLVPSFVYRLIYTLGHYKRPALEDTRLHFIEVARRELMEAEAASGRGDAQAARAHTEAFLGQIDHAVSNQLRTLSLTDPPERILSEARVTAPAVLTFGNGIGADHFAQSEIEGAEALNMTVELNGNQPVRVSIRRIDEPVIRVRSGHEGLWTQWTTFQDLASDRDAGSGPSGPSGPFGLHRRALQETGFTSAGVQEGDLEGKLRRLGGGLEIETRVDGLLQEGGLGRDSALTVALLKGLYGITGRDDVTEEEILVRGSRILLRERSSEGWSQLAAVLHGGTNWMIKKPGSARPEVDPAAATVRIQTRLKERLVLVRIGGMVPAEGLLLKVNEGYFAKNSIHYQQMRRAQRMGQVMREALRAGDLTRLASAMEAYRDAAEKALGFYVKSGRSEDLIRRYRHLADGVGTAGPGERILVFAAREGRTAELIQRLEAEPGIEVVRWDVSPLGVSSARMATPITLKGLALEERLARLKDFEERLTRELKDARPPARRRPAANPGPAARPDGPAFPTAYFFSDAHGAFAKVDAIVLRAFGDAFPGVFDGVPRIDPERTYAAQLGPVLKAAGFSWADARERIVFVDGGDLMDRQDLRKGESGYEVFQRWKELIELGMSDVVSGNHDDLVITGLMLLHLPWYQDFRFYLDEDPGHKKAYLAIERDIYRTASLVPVDELVRSKNAGMADNAERKAFWAEKFADYHEARAGEERVMWTEVFHKVWGESETADAPPGWNAVMEERAAGGGPTRLEKLPPLLRRHWNQLRGTNLEGVKIHTGVRAVGRMSAMWWRTLHENMKHAADQLPDEESRRVWTAALTMIEKDILPRLEADLRERLGRGEWWVRAIEAVYNQNHYTAEWAAWDWTVHPDWGPALFKELSERGAPVNLRNYFEDGRVMEMAELLQEHFSLYSKTVYGTFLHALPPVDLPSRPDAGSRAPHKPGQFRIAYQGRDYVGIGYPSEGIGSIWEGFDALEKSVREAKTPGDAAAAFNEIYRWYSDFTTRGKPSHEVEIFSDDGTPSGRLDAGHTLFTGNGIHGHLYLGHNPLPTGFARFAPERLRTIKGPYTPVLLREKHAVVRTDGGMSGKFGGQGLAVVVSPAHPTHGLRVLGFDADGDLAVESPDMLAADGTGRVLFKSLASAKTTYIRALLGSIQDQIRGTGIEIRTRAQGQAVTAGEGSTARMAQPSGGLPADVPADVPADGPVIWERVREILDPQDEDEARDQQRRPRLEKLLMAAALYDRYESRWKIRRWVSGDRRKALDILGTEGNEHLLDEEIFAIRREAALGAASQRLGRLTRKRLNGLLNLMDKQRLDGWRRAVYQNIVDTITGARMSAADAVRRRFEEVVQLADRAQASLKIAYDATRPFDNTFLMQDLTDAMDLMKRITEGQLEPIRLRLEQGDLEYGPLMELRRSVTEDIGNIRRALDRPGAYEAGDDELSEAVECLSGIVDWTDDVPVSSPKGYQTREILRARLNDMKGHVLRLEASESVEHYGHDFVIRRAMRELRDHVASAAEKDPAWIRDLTPDQWPARHRRKLFNFLDRIERIVAVLNPAFSDPLGRGNSKTPFADLNRSGAAAKAILVSVLEEVEAIRRELALFRVTGYLPGFKGGTILGTQSPQAGERRWPLPRGLRIVVLELSPGDAEVSVGNFVRRISSAELENEVQVHTLQAGETVEAALEKYSADLVVAPNDFFNGGQLVSDGIRRTAERRGKAIEALLYESFDPAIASPANVYVPFGDEDMRWLRAGMEEHDSQNKRTPYPEILTDMAEVAAMEGRMRGLLGGSGDNSAKYATPLLVIRMETDGTERVLTPEEARASIDRMSANVPDAIVAPHPDDAEIGVGGPMRRKLGIYQGPAAGVDVLVMTNGHRGVSELTQAQLDTAMRMLKADPALARTVVLNALRDRRNFIEQAQKARAEGRPVPGDVEKTYEALGKDPAALLKKIVRWKSGRAISEASPQLIEVAKRVIRKQEVSEAVSRIGIGLGSEARMLWFDIPVTRMGRMPHADMETVAMIRKYLENYFETHAEAIAHDAARGTYPAFSMTHPTDHHDMHVQTEQLFTRALRELMRSGRIRTPVDRRHYLAPWSGSEDTYFVDRSLAEEDMDQRIDAYDAGLRVELMERARLVHKRSVLNARLVGELALEYPGQVSPQPRQLLSDPDRAVSAPVSARRFRRIVFKPAWDARIAEALGTIFAWTGGAEETVPDDAAGWWLFASDSLETARQMAEEWTAFRKRSGRSIPIVVFGGVGGGTRTLDQLEHGHDLEDRRFAGEVLARVDRRLDEIAAEWEADRSEGRTGFWAMMKERYDWVPGYDAAKQTAGPDGKRPRAERFGFASWEKAYADVTFTPEETALPVETRILRRLLDPSTRRATKIPEALVYEAVLVEAGVPADAFRMSVASCTTNEQADSAARFYQDSRPDERASIVVSHQRFAQRRTMKMLETLLPIFDEARVLKGTRFTSRPMMRYRLDGARRPYLLYLMSLALDETEKRLLRPFTLEGVTIRHEPPADVTAALDRLRALREEIQAAGIELPKAYHPSSNVRMAQTADPLKEMADRFPFAGGWKGIWRGWWRWFSGGWTGNLEFMQEGDSATGAIHWVGMTSYPSSRHIMVTHKEMRAIWAASPAGVTSQPLDRGDGWFEPAITAIAPDLRVWRSPILGQGRSTFGIRTWIEGRLLSWGAPTVHIAPEWVEGGDPVRMHRAALLTFAAAIKRSGVSGRFLRRVRLAVLSLRARSAFGMNGESTTLTLGDLAERWAPLERVLKDPNVLSEELAHHLNEPVEQPALEWNWTLQEAAALRFVRQVDGMIRSRRLNADAIRTLLLSSPVRGLYREFFGSNPPPLDGTEVAELAEGLNVTVAEQTSLLRGVIALNWLDQKDPKRARPMLNAFLNTLELQGLIVRNRKGVSGAGAGEVSFMMDLAGREQAGPGLGDLGPFILRPIRLHSRSENSALEDLFWSPEHSLNPSEFYVVFENGKLLALAKKMTVRRSSFDISKYQELVRLTRARLGDAVADAMLTAEPHSPEMTTVDFVPFRDYREGDWYHRLTDLLSSRHGIAHAMTLPPSREIRARKTEGADPAALDLPFEVQLILGPRHPRVLIGGLDQARRHILQAYYALGAAYDVLPQLGGAPLTGIGDQLQTLISVSQTLDRELSRIRDLRADDALALAAALQAVDRWIGAIPAADAAGSMYGPVRTELHAAILLLSGARMSAIDETVQKIWFAPAGTDIMKERTALMTWLRANAQSVRWDDLGPATKDIIAISALLPLATEATNVLNGPRDRRVEKEWPAAQRFLSARKRLSPQVQVISQIMENLPAMQMKLRTRLTDWKSVDGTYDPDRTIWNGWFPDHQYIVLDEATRLILSLEKLKEGGFSEYRSAPLTPIQVKAEPSEPSAAQAPGPVAALTSTTPVASPAAPLLTLISWGMPELAARILSLRLADPEGLDRDGGAERFASVHGRLTREGILPGAADAWVAAAQDAAKSAFSTKAPFALALTRLERLERLRPIYLAYVAKDARFEQALISARKRIADEIDPHQAVAELGQKKSAVVKQIAAQFASGQPDHPKWGNFTATLEANGSGRVQMPAGKDSRGARRRLVFEVKELIGKDDPTRQVELRRSYRPDLGYFEFTVTSRSVKADDGGAFLSKTFRIRRAGDGSALGSAKEWQIELVGADADIWPGWSAAVSEHIRPHLKALDQGIEPEDLKPFEAAFRATNNGHLTVKGEGTSQVQFTLGLKPGQRLILSRILRTGATLVSAVDAIYTIQPLDDKGLPDGPVRNFRLQKDRGAVRITAVPVDRVANDEDQLRGAILEHIALEDPSDPRAIAPFSPVIFETDPSGKKEFIKTADGIRILLNDLGVNARFLAERSWNPQHREWYYTIRKLKPKSFSEPDPAFVPVHYRIRREGEKADQGLGWTPSDAKTRPVVRQNALVRFDPARMSGADAKLRVFAARCAAAQGLAQGARLTFAVMRNDRGDTVDLDVRRPAADDRGPGGLEVRVGTGPYRTADDPAADGRTRTRPQDALSVRAEAAAERIAGLIRGLEALPDTPSDYVMPAWDELIPAGTELTREEIEEEVRYLMEFIEIFASVKKQTRFYLPENAEHLFALTRSVSTRNRIENRYVARSGGRIRLGVPAVDRTRLRVMVRANASHGPGAVNVAVDPILANDEVPDWMGVFSIPVFAANAAVRNLAGVPDPQAAFDAATGFYDLELASRTLGLYREGAFDGGPLDTTLLPPLQGTRPFTDRERPRPQIIGPGQRLQFLRATIQRTRTMA